MRVETLAFKQPHSTHVENTGESSELEKVSDRFPGLKAERRKAFLIAPATPVMILPSV